MWKKCISILLCIAMMLPFTSCAKEADDMAERAPEPIMNIEDLQKLAAYEEQFPDTTPEESAKIWAWAHQVVTEWNERYEAILEEMKTETRVAGFEKDESEYSRSITVARNYQKVIKGEGTRRATRTLSSLKGWEASAWSKKTYERTVYGGFMDESAKQEATGFFYVKQLNGRWFLIDPLGYPTILTSVQAVTPSFSGNIKQKAWVAEEFGTDEKWAIATTQKLKKDHSVYGSTFAMGDGSLLYDVPEGFVNCSTGGPGITSYCIDVLDIAWDAGSTYFDPNISQYRKMGNEGKKLCNMVMPVFDRGFIEYLDQAGKTQLAPYANENRIVAWSCANEIPIKMDMLDRYLKYTDPAYMAQIYPDNPKTAYYYETYAVTMTWFRFMTGKDNPNQADITDELRSLFLGFVYDHLLYVCSQTYRKYVPNHLFLGVRWLSNGEAIVVDESNTIMARPWIARFASRHCDVIAINWYVRYYAPSSAYEEFSTWTQSKPIMITEFNGWTEDGTDYYMPNKDSASCFATQEERAAYFEHLTLDWMEWNTIVGWSWYRYNHYTINNKTQSSTSGILNDNGEYDLYLQASMNKINSQAYNIANYLHERREK